MSCVEERVREAREEAKRLHVLGYNCAEAVLGGTVRAARGEQPPLRIATGFGGGLGRTGSVCGAVTGAIAAFGWLRGRTSPDDKETYARCATLVRRFLADFAAAHGTMTCSELTGYDLRDPEVLPAFAADAARREKCARFIDTAASLAARAVLADGKGGESR
ncbi:MAG: C-GCAxxG-C-C family protein [Bacillota bacterium]|nr:C-GCAxxG-C-C family protein [Bacillota bacterium]